MRLTQHNHRERPDYVLWTLVVFAVAVIGGLVFLAAVTFDPAAQDQPQEPRVGTEWEHALGKALESAFDTARDAALPKPKPRSSAPQRPPRGEWSDAELTQLALNPEMRAFLERTHAWPADSASRSTRSFAWSDDRNALVYEGCETRYIDPKTAPQRLRITVDLDVDRMQRMQAHFGYSDGVLGSSFYTHTEELRSARETLTRRTQLALLGHGVRWKPSRRESENGLIGPDPRELVGAFAELVRPLAEQLVRDCRPECKGPHCDLGVEALTSFVQRAIPYTSVPPDRDGVERGGLRTPGATLLYGGDCDSKSLLLATLIRSVRPEVGLLFIGVNLDGEPHGMLGIAIDAPDCAKRIQHDGADFVLIESTSGFGIGYVSDDFRESEIYEKIALFPAPSHSER